MDMEEDNAKRQVSAEATQDETQKQVQVQAQATVMSESEFLKIIATLNEKLEEVAKANQQANKEIVAKLQEVNAPKEVKEVKEEKIPEKMFQILKDAELGSKPEEPLIAGTDRYRAEAANYADKVMREVYGQEYIYRNSRG